jgi:hypothetical protein
LTSTLHEPISEDGTPVIEKTYTVPARLGRAVRLNARETIRIANPHGTQVCHTWIFNAEHFNEFLLLALFGWGVLRSLDGLCRSCEFPAYRRHFVFGVMAPPDFRRNGATAFSA